jgi:hypothetical protein
MKLHFSHLLPNDEPINSVQKYLAVRRPYDELCLELYAVQLEMKQQRDEGKEPTPELFNKFDILDQRKKHFRSIFYRCQPWVLISRCPYCEKAVWMKVGVFSLIDEFWYRLYSDGREEVLDKSRCQHLFCVDGALSLNGCLPIEAYAPMIVGPNNKIVMAAEVPFVKPRVLNLPTMVAVIHSFPVAEKYTGYPVVYFAERKPKQSEFCIGWARREYFDYHRRSRGKATITGKRSDLQEYDLEKWIQQGKLFWLDLGDKEYPLISGSIEKFPYSNISGRRHPYYIKEGQVFGLLDPVQGEPEIRMEY